MNAIQIIRMLLEAESKGVKVYITADGHRVLSEKMNELNLSNNIISLKVVWLMKIKAVNSNLFNDYLAYFLFISAVGLELLALYIFFDKF